MSTEAGRRPPQALLSREHLFRLGEALLRDIPDAVVYADRDGSIRYWNPGAVRIFGYSEGEALGQSLDIIIPDRLRQRHWEGYRRMMETRRSQHRPDRLLSVGTIEARHEGGAGQQQAPHPRNREGCQR